MTPTVRADRASQVRRALVELVAQRGLHGASMASIAEHAGVATGTAYVHYRSKDELVIAAYVEVKAQLGEAAVATLDPGQSPEQQFRSVWHSIRKHLAADPVRARFMVQIDASPLAARAHAAALDDDAMVAAFSEAFRDRLAKLPMTLLYDLSLGPIVRAVASEEPLSKTEVERLVESCWRAVSR